LCGDFNCPGTGGNLLDANLADVQQRYSLTQHVRGATHVDGNTLDLLYKRGQSSVTCCCATNVLQ